jgi:condensin-2 complex subunit H2
LTQRVGEWQGRLIPILEEEEQRPAFDIHDYGETMIETMENEIKRHSLENADSPEVGKPANTTVDFRHVTRDCSRFEVCRMFLASLSLCNSGNITFIDTDKREETSSSLQMWLVSNDIERPAIL